MRINQDSGDGKDQQSSSESVEEIEAKELGDEEVRIGGHEKIGYLSETTIQEWHLECMYLHGILGQF